MIFNDGKGRRGMVVPTPNMILFLLSIFNISPLWVLGGGWCWVACWFQGFKKKTSSVMVLDTMSEGDREFGRYMLPHWSDLAFLGPAPFLWSGNEQRTRSDNEIRHWHFQSGNKEGEIRGWHKQMPIKRKNKA